MIRGVEKRKEYTAAFLSHFGRSVSWSIGDQLDGKFGNWWSVADWFRLGIDSGSCGKRVVLDSHE